MNNRLCDNGHPLMRFRRVVGARRSAHSLRSQHVILFLPVALALAAVAVITLADLW
jgi:hypothetical protein